MQCIYDDHREVVPAFAWMSRMHFNKECICRYSYIHVDAHTINTELRIYPCLYRLCRTLTISPGINTTYCTYDTIQKLDSSDEYQRSNFLAVISNCALKALTWLNNPPYDPSAAELTCSETLRSRNSRPVTPLPLFVPSSSSSSALLRFPSRARSRLCSVLLMALRD